jgi:hypothetical protein
MSILYLVIASDSPEHIKDELTQRNTWAEKLKDRTIWLRGGSKEFFDETSQTLHVNITEEYRNILAKTILGIKWCLKNRDFDFIVRSNVSTYFSSGTQELKISKSLNKNGFLGGYIDYHYVRGDRIYNNQFVNGGAIFLDRISADVLCSLDPDQWENVPDDVAISSHLMSYGIMPTWIPRGNVSSTGILTRRFYYRMKSSANPEMASFRMQNLHRLSKESRWLKKIFRYVEFEIDEIKSFRKNFINIREYLKSVYSVISCTYKSKRIWSSWIKR